MTIYVEAPWIVKTPIVGRSIFLAGGITGCWNWQDVAKTKLMESQVFDFVINPRREYFDVSDKFQTPIQIKWEYEHLKYSSQIMFWFTADTVQPITLFELGKSIGTDKTIYVGCDPEYPRQQDVVEQLRLSRPDIYIWGSLDNMLDFIVSHCDKAEVFS